MEKFSKSLIDIAKIKQDFASKNDQLLTSTSKINQNYTQQPKRKSCKTCRTDIGIKVDFRSHGVDYMICETCGHVNGLHEDTVDFCTNLYSADGGSNYSSNYIDGYQLRVKNIYLPKIDFLIEALHDKCDCTDFQNNLTLTDLGCGGGHFVHAARKRGIKAVGFDISEDLIDIGKTVYRSTNTDGDPEPFIKVQNESELLDAALKTKSQVISMIGVIEHLRDPLSFVEAFRQSKANYLYLSVPLLSYSVFVENVFPHIYPRHLSGGHTHLYTQPSIKYIMDKYSLREVGSWHFGADAMDLRRSMLTSLNKNKCSNKFYEILEEQFFSPEIMDQFQQILDRNYVASEVHLILEQI